VRNWEDYEAMIKAGEYDVARRSVVLQTTDEETNMLALFGEQPRADTLPREVAESSPQADASATPKDDDAGLTPDRRSPDAQALPAFLTEAQALKELPAVPLYFASSYALVKPYVRGFDSNLLDAPSLKHVSINMNWKPPAQNETISIVRNNVR
jgi:hypothetical protein